MRRLIESHKNDDHIEENYESYTIPDDSKIKSDLLFYERNRKTEEENHPDDERPWTRYHHPIRLENCRLLRYNTRIDTSYVIHKKKAGDLTEMLKAVEVNDGCSEASISSEH